MKNPSYGCVIVLLVFLAACHDNGGSSGLGDPVVVRIAASGVGTSLWAGATTLPPNCVAGLNLNAQLVFTFGGAVDPAGLPALGAALGGINITTMVAGADVPAQGGFEVSDDPSLPPGNRRVVTFFPAASTSAANPSLTGLASGSTYTIFIPDAATSTSALTVGGAPLANSALCCFVTCSVGATNCLADPLAGPPFVLSTSPPTGDPAPSSVLASAISGNRLSIFVSEALLVAPLSLGTVRVVDVANSLQVPGSIVFFQAGTPEAGPHQARIDYVAASPFNPGRTFELLLDSMIVDVAGNSIALFNPTGPGVPASGRRFFSTTAQPSCPQAPIVENFSTTAQLASVSSAAVWAGDGRLTIRFPDELTGNGAFGNLVAPVGPSTLDSGMATVPGPGGTTAFQNGVWNTTSFIVPVGASVRCVGSRALYIRCTGTADIQGTLNLSAGKSLTAALGSPEQGPRNGNFNNGSPGQPPVVAGGFANAGGGRGGQASQADPQGPAVRTTRAETGRGARIDGAENPGPAGNNPFFGGGEGGFGAFNFPSGGMSGDVGGFGGAGGSAFSAGSEAGPNTPAPNCVPAPPGNQPRALATGAVSVFAPPISGLSGGSGGGGGGDKFDPSGVSGDDQGAGGGGGGGGLRISSFGAITLAAGSSLDASGAGAGTGNIFQGGHGGAGSGGEIWLQSFNDVVISNQATLNANPTGIGNLACGNQAGGAGGLGLCQIEDRDGIVNTSFLGPVSGGSNLFVTQNPFAASIAAVAVSAFYDAGTSAADYTAVIETVSLGSLSATIAITYQGARELLNGGGPDLTTLSAPVTAAQIDGLDGYRYVRFSATISFPTPATGSLPPGVLLPEIDEIRVLFLSPVGCP